MTFSSLNDQEEELSFAARFDGKIERSCQASKQNVLMGFRNVMAEI